MRKMELSWKIGGEWIPAINRNSGLLKLGGPVFNKSLFTEMKSKGVLGDMPGFWMEKSALEWRILVTEQETQLSAQQAIIFALLDCPITVILAPAALSMTQCPLLMQHNFAFAEETGALIGKTNPRSTKRNMTFFSNFDLAVILCLYRSGFNLSNRYSLQIQIS